ncbi:MAG: ABC transporter substrate-binding protein [Oscillospiraceae bacterium]|nr:ABC transporter substrate-binding protein [Oscillospiraceae bacterium]
MKAIKILIVLATLFAILTLTACAGEQLPGGADTRTVTDVWGREVEIPVNVETIITLGSGAPRIASYLDVMDMLVGAEEYSIRDDVFILRDYHPVHHGRFLTLPVVGSGGGSGNNNGFPEEIIAVSPDVILAGFDAEAADELQSQTGIPVVSVRHSTGLAPDDFYTAMRVFAEVVGAQERAEFVLAFIDSMKEDLHNRTYSVPESDKLRAYAGAVTWNGRRGISGTYSVFGIFDAINAVNVAHVPAIPGFFEADLESIIIWDPDVIFLDPGNMDLVNDEYRVNPGFFNSLRAVQEGRVYTMPAFNFAGTNMTYAFMSTYFAGIVLFPEQFADVDIVEKSAEILTTFLGVNTFDIMVENGLFFGNLTIGE